MTTTAHTLKGINSRTGTVHYARTEAHRAKQVSSPMLVQVCGMNQRQHVYLDKVAENTPVTCKRCLKNNPDQTTSTKESQVPSKATTPAETTSKKTTTKPAKTSKATPKTTEKTGKTEKITRVPNSRILRIEQVETDSETPDQSAHLPTPVTRTGVKIDKTEQQKDEEYAEGVKRAKVSKSTKSIKSVKKVEDDTTEIANKIKALREQGMAWWRIGYELNLPGSANTVAKGKAGAARARKLYKKHFGALPARQKTTSSERKDRKAERAERARNGKPLFDSEATAEEIKTMIAGKEITWSIDLGKLSGGEPGSAGYSEENAVVHPDRLVVEDGKNGERCVRFRELSKGGMAGATRTVRLSAIHTIR